MANTSDSQPAAETWDGQNVIAVSFEDDRNAYTALTSLKELDSQERVGVREASVVERGEDGQLQSKDSVGPSDMPATAAGGLMGLLLGILGGPLGVLIGGSYGLFVGSLFDLGELTEADSALGEISSTIKTGHTALLAVVDEQSPEVVDAAMAQAGGTVARRRLADVEAEIAAAEDAERTAKREARKELMRGRRDRDKAAIEAKVNELKAKLHHESQRPAEADGTPAGAASGAS
jgi:uncharacterized membrane protein